uniref:hypothetical protein n=1 Tax=Bacillus velezensis TaxID=492670 RepID=UPI001C92D2C0
GGRVRRSMLNSRIENDSNRRDKDVGRREPMRFDKWGVLIVGCKGDWDRVGDNEVGNVEERGEEVERVGSVV